MFGIDEERVEKPNRVEDQTNLGEIKTLGSASEFEGAVIQNKNVPDRPWPVADPSGSKTES
jgi:hypothetical protein